MVFIHYSFSDDIAASNFLYKYKPQDAIKYEYDSSTNPPTKYNPDWADYKAAGDKLSLKEEFDQAYKKLKKKHYSEKLLNTFAQVYLLQKFNAGIQISIKVNLKNYQQII